MCAPEIAVAQVVAEVESVGTSAAEWVDASGWHGVLALSGGDVEVVAVGAAVQCVSFIVTGEV